MNIKSATLVPKKELEDKIIAQLFKGKQEDEYWTAFPGMDARTISFSDGTTITVSKNYVFLDEREAQVFADEMVEGTEIVSKATGEKIKVTSVTATKTTLYGFYSKTRREDSLCGLMEKLAVRRDYWHIKNGKEMVLNWSFTPFTAKNSTPFQFAGCMAGLSNKKTLTPAVEKARQLGMKFRVGTSSDVSTLAQVLTLGDRRLNKVIYRAYKEKAVDYYGGMGCGSDSVEKFAKILKEETGHDYKVYGEEKWLNQVMPWDFIDIGMTKEHLKERYLLARSNMNSPFGCFVRCVQCGACNVSQQDLPQELTRDVSSDFTIID